MKSRCRLYPDHILDTLHTQAVVAMTERWIDEAYEAVASGRAGGFYTYVEHMANRAVQQAMPRPQRRRRRYRAT